MTTAANGWQVILLIDKQELTNVKKGRIGQKQMRARLDRQGISYRFETLPAGYYAWVAHNKMSGRELVLDCLIERKEVEDMEGSLKQKSRDFTPLNKMKLQMLKIVASGIRNKKILREESMRSSMKRCGNLQAAKTFYCPSFGWKVWRL